MELPSTTFVVLGLLAKRPRSSGYDVAAFAERSVAHFWPLTRSQLYSELARLEDLGYVRGTAVSQDRYPDKRVYEPTEAGVDALRRWLDTAGFERVRAKNGALVKVFFGEFMSPERGAELLAEYRAAAEQQLAHLTAVDEHLRAKGLDRGRLHGLATVRYGIRQAEATIAWTREAESLLEGTLAAEPVFVKAGPEGVAGREGAGWGRIEWV